MSVPSTGFGGGFRWQVELLFKEFKSHASLKKLNTAQPAIVTGLIWASLLAALVKRTLVAVAERVTRNPVSTLKTAMLGFVILPLILQALRDDTRAAIDIALRNIAQILGRTSKRAHPDRDAKTGRMAIPLIHAYALS